MRLGKAAPVVAAVLLVASAAGCTGDGSPEPPEPEPTQAGATARSQQTAAEAPAAEVEGSTQGGTITVRAATAPTTFDPTRVSSHQTEAILTNLVTRSLTQYQYDPATKQMVLVPDMATGLGRPNANFTRWTFTLRAGLKYETGAPVQATDVAYAIKRSFATDELPGGPTYNKRLYTGGEAYDGPYEDGPDLKGIEVDGRSITIKLRRPFADMPYLASSPQYTAIPAAADNPSEDYGNHPLATGPYKFAGYHPGSGLTLVRNPYWDPATDTTRHQYVDRWKFRWGAQAAATDKQLLTDDGAAQTSLSYDNVAPDLYDEAKQQAEDRLVTGTRPCTHMWYLDTRKIRSVKVRKAIGYAYPYRAAWRAAGEIAGVTRLPGTTILPPGTAGRVAYDPLGTKGVETDTARARTLLRKAGKTGYEVRFPFRSDTPSGVAAKNRIVGALESAGFKATPIATTEGQHRKQVAGRDSRQNVHAQTWCGDWPTGSAWFSGQRDESPVQAPGVLDPAFLGEDQARSKTGKILDTMSGKKANTAWGRLDRFVEQTYYPVVVTGYDGLVLLHGSKVGGMEANSVYGMPTFSSMYVEQ